MSRRIAVGIVVFLVASLALASWYDDYEAGIAAVRAGQWRVVIEKMSAALKGNTKENNNARTYGNHFINYHPYYYRGLAYLRTGEYEKAIGDFEKTSGPGEIDRGSIETLMQEAKTKQASATEPQPQPQPIPRPVPTPVPVPQPPAIDPALRQQLNTALDEANQSLGGARSRKATSSPKYDQAVNALADANSRAASARTNDDLRAAIAAANNAKLFADSAMPASVPTPVPVPVPQPPGPGGKPIPPLFEEYQPQLRQALENYYSGEFELAARDFKALSAKLPTNGWIWAFLGASQYSYYAFEADESSRNAAMDSFRKAKKYRFGKNGLPEKYFSKRIRRVFQSAG